MRVTNILSNIISFPFILVIRAYQLLISPFLGQNCRFYPSCSHYSHQAIKQHGPIIGLVLATRRITKCHPFNEGGHDPVPTTPLVFKRFTPYIHNNSLIDNTHKPIVISDKKFNDN